jgi:hypothetical protein
VRKDFLDGTAVYGGECACQEFVLKRQFRDGPDVVAQWIDPTTLSLSGLAGLLWFAGSRARFCSEGILGTEVAW